MQIDPSKSEAHRLRVMAQKRFFDSARNHPKVRFFKGHFLGFGKEKGVDVRLAVDMTVGAATKLFDDAVLTTGAADLMYAAPRTRALGKVVHLVALGSRFQFSIVPVVEHVFVYDLNGFFRQQVLPRVGVGHSMPLMLPGADVYSAVCTMLVCLSSFALDYVSRQRMDGTNRAYGYRNQCLILKPSAYQQLAPWCDGCTVGAWLLPRVIELAYMAWDLEPFAKDCGYEGPPFR